MKINLSYRGRSHVSKITGITMSGCGINCRHNEDKIPLYSVYLITPINERLTKDEAQHLIQNYQGQGNYKLEVKQKGFKPKDSWGSSSS